jgi:hypothetical protein
MRKAQHQLHGMRPAIKRGKGVHAHVCILHAMVGSPAATRSLPRPAVPFILRMRASLRHPCGILEGRVADSEGAHAGLPWQASPAQAHIKTVRPPASALQGVAGQSPGPTVARWSSGRSKKVTNRFAAHL